MPYQRILGSSARERKAKRDRERAELETWTKNRDGGFTGRLYSQDSEVRERWASFFGIKKRHIKKYVKPRGFSRRYHPGNHTPPNRSPPFSSSEDETEEPSESTPFPEDPSELPLGTLTPLEFLESRILRETSDVSEFWKASPGGTSEIWEAMDIVIKHSDLSEVKS